MGQHGSLAQYASGGGGGGGGGGDGGGGGREGGGGGGETAARDCSNALPVPARRVIVEEGDVNFFLEKKFAE